MVWNNGANNKPGIAGRLKSCSEVGVSCGWDEAIRKSREEGERRGEVEVEEGKGQRGKRGYLCMKEI